METDAEGNISIMTAEEHQKYKTELRNELAELEFAQEMFYSKYKERRINILKDHLGIAHE